MPNLNQFLFVPTNLAKYLAKYLALLSTNSNFLSSPLPPSSPSSFPPLLPSFTASQAKLLENQVARADHVDDDGVLLHDDDDEDDVCNRI